MKRAASLFRVSAAVIFLVAIAAPSYASDLNGFLREKGHGDVAFSYTAESYDSFWVGTTEVDVPNGGDVDTTSASLWFIYGITDDFSLIADLPYVKAESDGFDMEESGAQDLTVLGEYRFATLGSGSCRHHLLGAAGFRTHASDYEANQPVDIGDGTTDALFRFVYQLQKGAFYFSQQVGFDLRNEDAPNGWPLYSEIGYTWGPITLSGSFSLLRAEGGTDIGDPGFTFPSNAEEYRKAGAKIYGRITDNFGVTGSYFTTLDGRNTGESSGFSVGADFGF